MGQQYSLNPLDIWYIHWDRSLILVISCWKCTDKGTGILNICQLFVILR